MKRFTLTFAIVGAFCALAFGGPEPLSSGKEVMPAPPPPTSCFEGWYFGIHGGGIYANLNTETSAFEQTISPSSGEEPGVVNTVFDSNGKDNESSWEAGLHAGYNWQRGGWVFGLEADISGSDLRRQESASDFFLLPPGESFVYTTEITSKSSLDWYGTGRIRVGHTLGDRILAFGTGGGAFGLTEVSEVTSVHEATPVGGQFTDQFSNTDRGIRGGWTAGAGVDFCLTNHIILNFTYLYVDLGDTSVGTNVFVTSGQGRTFDSETRARSDFKFHVFQGGLSFKF
jgi:outer membrane immunogenic protein